MAVFDFDGTASYEVSRIFDHNGTANHKIGYVYDHDGTTNHLIFRDETVLLDGTTGADLWQLNLTAGSSSAVLTINGGIYASQPGNGSDDILVGDATTKDFYNLGEYESITYSVLEYGTKPNICGIDLVDENGTVTRLKDIFNLDNRETAKETAYNDTVSLSRYTGNYKIRFWFNISAYYDATRTTVTKCILD